MTSSGNGTTTVTITTPPISTTHNSSSNLNNNTNIINSSTTQQLHIQTTPIQNSIINNNNANTNNNNNNNNTVTINANNGIKKKRFSVNILNVKPSGGGESSDDVEAENQITFAPSVTPAVKEESVAPWQAVTEAIQEIPADYAVDQNCEIEN
jgi:hypothetical protein